MPYMGKEKTDGGIHVPDSIREKEGRATVVAYVVKLEILAYKDFDKFGEEGLGVRKATGFVLVVTMGHDST